MSRALLVLSSEEVRDKALRWVQKAPEGTRLTFQSPKRSLPQNDLFWKLATQVSEQVAWHGVKLSPDDWKLVFLDALKRELRMVPNIDGTALVSLGRSSSDLSKEEFSDLIEIVYAFGAKHGVMFDGR